MVNDKQDAAPGITRRRSFDFSLIGLACGAFVFGAGLSRWRELISNLFWLSSP
jgi:hypothetical protein